MMRETASAKATAPPKQVIHEAPVKFRSGKHTAIVKEVFDIAPQFPPTYLIRFTFENESVFDFEPGQFISIFAEKDGKRISRPYSIASWPENKAYLELCIKVVEGGSMSNYLHHVRPGRAASATSRRCWRTTSRTTRTNRCSSAGSTIWSRT